MNGLVTKTSIPSKQGSRLSVSETLKQRIIVYCFVCGLVGIDFDDVDRENPVSCQSAEVECLTATFSERYWMVLAESSAFDRRPNRECMQRFRHTAFSLSAIKKAAQRPRGLPNQSKRGFHVSSEFVSSTFPG